MTERDQFSNQAFAIQVCADDGGAVSHVLVGRRPPGLYGGSDRSHLTGWEVFVDGVRNHVVGLSFRDALARVIWLGTIAEGHKAHAFAALLRDEPMRAIRDRRKVMDDPGGVKRGNTGELATEPAKKRPRITEPVTAETEGEPEDTSEEESEDYPTKTPRQWYERATAHWTEVKNLVSGYLSTTPPPQPTVDSVDDGNEEKGARDDDAPVFTAAQEYELCLLQRLISAYLHFRNTLPLTAVHENKPRGGAIAAANAVMAAERTREADLDGDAKLALANDLWGLFDSGALKNLITDRNAKEQLFGEGMDGADHMKICLAALADHVLSVEVAYPRASTRSDLRQWVRPFTARAPFSAWEEALDAAGDDLPPTTLPGPATGLLPGPATGLPDGTGDQANVYDRFAVQLDMDQDGTVRAMYVGARPSSPAGRHTTAWVVLCDYVRSLVVGEDLAAITGALKREFETISAFYTGCGFDEPEPLDDYEGSALECAQLRIAAFLDFLNKTEGAIVDTGGLSGGGNEGRYRAVLQRSGAYETVLKMFDWRCPSKLLDQGAEGDSETDEEIDNIPTIALRVALHLHMCATAYGARLDPAVVAGLRGYEGLALLHASYNIATVAAHEANKLIWGALIASAATNEDEEEEEPPDYDPDVFEEHLSHYAGAGGEGSQGEYLPSQ